MVYTYGYLIRLNNIRYNFKAYKSVHYEFRYSKYMQNNFLFRGSIDNYDSKSLNRNNYNRISLENTLKTYR